MALETNSYAQAAGPDRSFADYQQQYQGIAQNALNIQGARQKLDAYTQDQAEKASMRNYLSGNPDLSTAAGYNGLMAAAPTLGPGIHKAYQDSLTSQALASKDTAQAGQYNAETETKKYELGRQKLDRAMQMVSQSPTAEVAKQHLSELVQHGLMSMQDATAKSQEIDQASAQSGGYNQWRLGSMAALMSAHDQFEANKPTLGTRNNGQTLENTATNPMTGVPTVTASTQLQATPGEVLSNGVAAARLAEDRRHNSATEANSNGQVTYQTDANGNMVAVPSRVAPGTTVQGQTVVDASGKVIPGKSNLTETQGKATTFAARMADADSTIKRMEAQGVSGSDFRTIAAGSGYTNWFASPEGQQYRQAQENWVTANLRQESGAAIGVDEMTKDVRKFFPAPGDSEKVKEQKAKSREVAQRGMMVQAGPGAKQVAGIVGATDADGTQAAAVPSGFKITHVDGKPQ